MNQRLAAWIAGTITVMWVLTVGVGVINPHYNAPASVQATMLLVAGGATSEAIHRRKGDHDDE